MKERLKFAVFHHRGAGSHDRALPIPSAIPGPEQSSLGERQIIGDSLTVTVNRRLIVWRHCWPLALAKRLPGADGRSRIPPAPRALNLGSQVEKSASLDSLSHRIK